MADIQELVLTFLESLSHNALRFTRKRETLDARMSFIISKIVEHSLQKTPRELTERFTNLTHL